jgi:tetratricopeptide (TPR) repeat protein
MGYSPTDNAQQLKVQAASAAAPPLFTKIRPFLPQTLLVALTIIAYTQLFSCGFIEAYDDEVFITKNMVVLQGVTWKGLKWSFSSFLTGNWHPLTWWSHMLDVSIYGLNPVGHHITSLILHILNSILLYTFLKKTTGCSNRSFLVAALFALHPLHVESVAWISERKDLLSTVFGLMALHLYTRYAQTRQRTYYLAMFTLFCLSLMSKPMLVTFPFLLLVLDYWPLMRLREQPVFSLIREKIPLFLPVLLISVLTIVAQKSVGAISNQAIISRTYSALDAYVVYLRKFFAPYDLTSYYPYSPISPTSIIFAALVLTGFTLCAWHYRHRCPWLISGWLWFLGLLVPVIGFITVGAQAYADRYTYLPAVGISIIAVWLVAEYFDKTGLPFWGRAMSAAVVIVVCSITTWNQTGYWKGGFSLYDRELAIVKDNWHAHNNLGTMLVNRERYDEGIEHYQKALLNNPPSEANLYHNLGVAYERKGDKALSLAAFSKTIQMSPNQDMGYLGVARILDSTKDTAGALSAISIGLRYVPDNWLLLSKKAYLLHKMGDFDAAEKVYRQAITKTPHAVQNYMNLGTLLMQQGKKADLTSLGDKLRRINPEEADNFSKKYK